MAGRVANSSERECIVQVLDLSKWLQNVVGLLVLSGAVCVAVTGDASILFPIGLTILIFCSLLARR